MTMQFLVMLNYKSELHIEEKRLRFKTVLSTVVSSTHPTSAFALQ